MTRRFGAPVGSAFVTTVDLLRSAGTTLAGPQDDGFDGSASGAILQVYAKPTFWAPVTARWERMRTPDRSVGFHSLRTTGINAAQTVWTPAAGKKFRLMGLAVQVSGGAALAVAQIVNLSIADNGTAIFGGGTPFSVSIPAAANADPRPLFWSDWIPLPGNGYLSSAANNVLQITGDAAGALTAGVLSIFTAGTEE